MNATHALADLQNVRSALLDESRISERIKTALVNAAEATKLTVVRPPVVDHVSEEEIVGFVLLAESHISIHYYPKLQVMKIDVFSCGSESPMKGIETLAKYLQGEITNIRIIDRTKTCQ